MAIIPDMEFVLISRLIKYRMTRRLRALITMAPATSAIPQNTGLPVLATGSGFTASSRILSETGMKKSVAKLERKRLRKVLAFAPRSRVLHRQTFQPVMRTMGLVMYAKKARAT